MANVWEVKGTTATYKVDGTLKATIEGLASGLKAVADGEAGDTKIEGIEVNGDTITFTSRKVLGSTDVTLKQPTGGSFTLALSEDGGFEVDKTAGGWLVSGTDAYLLSGESSGYEETTGNLITFIAAKPGSETIAKVSGLKSGLSTNQDGQIDGISFNGGTVTIESKSVLNKETVTIEGNRQLDISNAVKPQASGDVTWTSKKGTEASFSVNTTDGYALDAKTGSITYVKESAGTVTLSGLKNATDEKLNEGGSAIVDNKNGVIKLKVDVFEGSNKVTIKCTGVDYELALNEDDEATYEAAADVSDPAWYKKANATSATLSRVADAGYYSYGTNISKLTKAINSDGTGGTTITLATLGGLGGDAKTAEWKGESTDAVASDYGIRISGKTITVEKLDSVGTANLTLGKNDSYNLAITEDLAVGDVREHWEYKGGKATIVKGTTGGFLQKDSKTVNYVKPTSTTLATVTGLVNYKNVEDFDAYTPYDPENDKDDNGEYSTGIIDGLDFELAEYNADGSLKTLGTITVSQNILADDNGAVLVKDELKGVKKLTLGAKDNYKFVFDTSDDETYKVQTPTDDVEGAKWNIGEKTITKNNTTETVGTGTWTYTLDTSLGWEIDDSTKGASKTINFVPAKTTLLATVSNLTTEPADQFGFETEEKEIDGKFVDVRTGTVFYTGDGGNETALTIKDGVIQLSKPAVGGKKISLKSATDSSKTPLYTLGIDSTVPVVHERTDDEIQWSADKTGKAVLEGGTTEGYAVDTKSKGAAINYTAKKVTALATLTGLGKNLDSDAIEDLNEALNAEGVITKKPTATEAGEITLNSEILSQITDNKTTKVELGKNDKYQLKLGDLVEYAPNGNPELKLKTTTKNNVEIPTGDAIYSAEMIDGYVLSGDGKKVTYADAPEGGEIIATLSGFITDGEKINNDALNQAVGIDDANKTFTLNDASLLKADKLTLKNGTNSSYSLAVADNLKDKEEENPIWEISGGKATYYKGTTGGYAVDTKGTSISKVKPTTKETLASITGLSKNTTSKSFEIRNVGNDNLILITADAVKNSTSPIKLTTSSNYKLSPYGVPGVTITDSDWTKKDGTAVATKTRTSSAGWTTSSDGKAINYSKEKTETLVTVSGLKKSITEDEINKRDLLSLNSETKIVTVLNEALDNAKVTIKGGTKDDPYTLAPGSDVPTTTTPNTKYWTVSGGKATYYTGSTPHYALGTGNLSLEYKTYKPDKTLATVSGLKKTASASDFELSDDGVITLKATAVDWTVKDITKTKVTLKGDGYSLAFDYDSTDGENYFTKGEIGNAWGEWKSNKVLYESGVTEPGFMVSADGKTAYYGKTTDKKTTLATLTGVGKAPADPENGVITLSTEELNESAKTTLGKNDKYTFALSEVDAPTASGTWEVKNGTATLKGTKTAGYLKTDDKTVAYTKATADGKTETLATIKGVTAESLDSLESGSKTISLTKDQVGSTVTVDGKGILAFDFGDKSSASITGSASNDSLTFAGSNDSVNPAKGNDYVKFSGTGNTLIYASGDGYDLVEGFSANDNIEITKKDKLKSLEITGDGTNTYVNVDNKGIITLEGYTASSVKINGTPTDVKTSSSDLLLDDNYSMDAAALSEIVTANTGSYSPYQFSNSLKLTKEENFLPAIAYASDKK